MHLSMTTVKQHQQQTSWSVQSAATASGLCHDASQTQGLHLSMTPATQHQQHMSWSVQSATTAPGLCKTHFSTTAIKQHQQSMVLSCTMHNHRLCNLSGTPKTQHQQQSCHCQQEGGQGAGQLQHLRKQPLPDTKGLDSGGERGGGGGQQKLERSAMTHVSFGLLRND